MLANLLEFEALRSHIVLMSTSNVIGMLVSRFSFFKEAASVHIAVAVVVVVVVVIPPPPPPA